MTSATAIQDEIARTDVQHALDVQCPRCTCHLGQIPNPEKDSDACFFCSLCGFELACVSGIWNALPQEREKYFGQFVSQYQTVRAAEGRGSPESKYYLQLPYHDVTGRNSWQWSIRAKSFRYLQHAILPSLETRCTSSLNVLDLGAGNGWLSYRIALCGHYPVAVDLLINSSDGLGSAVHFGRKLRVLFPRFRAELDHLPFCDSQFDVAIFNASFHYSEDYERTLAEAARCLRPSGVIIIADTPWYSNDASGSQMLAERHSAFESRYGFASNSIASLEYLTDQRLKQLEQRFEIRWQIHSPFYGMRWAMRPWLAKLRRKREPSRFRIYVATVCK